MGSNRVLALAVVLGACGLASCAPAPGGSPDDAPLATDPDPARTVDGLPADAAVPPGGGAVDGGGFVSVGTGGRF